MLCGYLSTFKLLGSIVRAYCTMQNSSKLGIDFKIMNVKPLRHHHMAGINWMIQITAISSIWYAMICFGIQPYQSPLQLISDYTPIRCVTLRDVNNLHHHDFLCHGISDVDCKFYISLFVIVYIIFGTTGNINVRNSVSLFPSSCKLLLFYIWTTIN